MTRMTIVYSAAAVICFLVIFFVTYPEKFWGQEEQKNNNVRIVAFGDSVFGECRDETSVTEQLSAFLGEPVLNAALGGTCFSYMDSEKRLGYTKDSLNMIGLSQAILADDFRVQKNARIRESSTEYFDDTIEELSAIDFENVDIVFIAHGLNDYHCGVAFINEEDPYDTYTFIGAIRSTVRNLRKVNPQIRIILVTPTYTWYRANELTCEEYNPGGGTLNYYVDAELLLAEELGVEVIDLYHDFYPHEKWEDWEIYTNEGLHPNEAGRTLIARALGDYLAEHPGSKP